MADRGAPPASTSYYRPPLGLRHLVSLSARNLVPPGGAPARLAGVGAFFTLTAADAEDASEDASSAPDASASSSPPRTSEDTLVYVSEVARDTLNPDWEPFDDRLLRAARRRHRRSVRVRSRRDDDRGDDETRFLADPPHPPPAPLILRVMYVPSVPSSARSARTLHSSSCTAASIVCTSRIALDDLVPFPDAVGARDASSSSSSRRLFAPPNTPFVRVRGGTHDGDAWYVPGDRSWDALRAAATESKLADRFVRRDDGSEGFGAKVASASVRDVRRAVRAMMDARRRLEAAEKERGRLGERVAALAAAGKKRREKIFDDGGNAGASKDAEENIATAGASKDAEENIATAGASTSAPLFRLAALESSTRAARRRVGKMRRTLLEFFSEANDARAAVAARAAALDVACASLVAARERLASADELLAGAWGRGRLHQQQRLLVRRRWELVGDLAAVFPVVGDRVAGAALDPPPSRRAVRSDRGGERGASDESSAPTDPESCAAALGYVTQATLQLASVLDVPLRYPVAPGASRSYICDLQQVPTTTAIGAESGSGAGEKSAKSAAAANAAANAAGVLANGNDRGGVSVTSRTTAWRRVEFPLFGVRVEAPRFAHAVFLLNKNLEQLLNAHGLLAVGPRHTLANLRRLFNARTKAFAPSAAAARAATVEVTEGTGVKTKLPRPDEGRDERRDGTARDARDRSVEDEDRGA